MQSAQDGNPVNDRLVAAAVQVLRDNDLGEITKPSPTLYPHQWLWDSCFIAIGLRHVDPDRATREILSLFRGQWTNGMLPHVIFSQSDVYYHAGPERWRTDLVTATAGGAETTGVTQPPMVAEAVVRVGEVLEPRARTDFYRAVFPGLVRYHSWMYRERDPWDNGLVTLVHPWESGMDNTPPWMRMTRQVTPWRVRALQAVNSDGVLDLLRRDSKEVPADERLSGADLFTLYRIIRELRDARYDMRRIMDTSVPLVQDVAFNAILIRANAHLVAIAEALDERLPAGLKRCMGRTPDAFRTLLRSGDSTFLNRDARAGTLIPGETVGGFLALYAGVLRADEAAHMAERIIQPRWWPRLGVASAPTDDAEFKPHCYWQGPAWVNMNWLIADGLDRYGLSELAGRIRRQTVEMVAAGGGMFEYYSPLDGQGVGSDHFSWTAALVIDLLAGSVTAPVPPQRPPAARVDPAGQSRP
ncbi:MAG: amylo-alpha-1,6-glucosidase [Frankia sp.]